MPSLANCPLCGSAPSYMQLIQTVALVDIEEDGTLVASFEDSDEWEVDGHDLVQCSECRGEIMADAIILDDEDDLDDAKEA